MSKYTNQTVALRAKLHNRRVLVSRTPDGEWSLRYTRLIGREIHNTAIHLSHDAMMATVHLVARLCKECPIDDEKALAQSE